MFSVVFGLNYSLALRTKQTPYLEKKKSCLSDLVAATKNIEQARVSLKIDSFTLLTGVNGFLPMLSVSLDRFRTNLELNTST